MRDLRFAICTRLVAKYALLLQAGLLLVSAKMNQILIIGEEPWLCTLFLAVAGRSPHNIFASPYLYRHHARDLLSVQPKNLPSGNQGMRRERCMNLQSP